MPKGRLSRLEQLAFRFAFFIAPLGSRELVLPEWREMLSESTETRVGLRNSAQIAKYAANARFRRITGTPVGFTAVLITALGVSWGLAEYQPWVLVLTGVMGLQFAKGDLRLRACLPKRAVTLAQLVLLIWLALAGIQPTVFWWMQNTGPRPAERFSTLLESGLKSTWYAAFADGLALTAAVFTIWALVEILITEKRKRLIARVGAIAAAALAIAFTIRLLLRAFPAFTWAYKNAALQQVLMQSFQAGVSVLTVLGLSLFSRSAREALSKVVRYQTAVAVILSAGSLLTGLYLSTTPLPAYEQISTRPLLFDGFASTLSESQKADLSEATKRLLLAAKSLPLNVSSDPHFKSSRGGAGLSIAEKWIASVWMVDSPYAPNPKALYNTALAIANSHGPTWNASSVDIGSSLSGRCLTSDNCLLRGQETTTWVNLHTSESLHELLNFETNLQRSRAGWRLKTLVSWHDSGDG